MDNHEYLLDALSSLEEKLLVATSSEEREEIKRAIGAVEAQLLCF